MEGRGVERGRKGWVRHVGWREDFKNPLLAGCRMATDASIICPSRQEGKKEGGRVRIGDEDVWKWRATGSAKRRK